MSLFQKTHLNPSLIVSSLTFYNLNVMVISRPEGAIVVKYSNNRKYEL